MCPRTIKLSVILIMFYFTASLSAQYVPLVKLLWDDGQYYDTHATQNLGSLGGSQPMGSQGQYDIDVPANPDNVSFDSGLSWRKWGWGLEADENYSDYQLPEMQRITVAFWAKPVLSNLGMVICGNRGTGTLGWEVLDESGVFTVRLGSQTISSSNSGFIVDEWHHYAFTYTMNDGNGSSRMVFYRDGVAESVTVSYSGVITAPANGFLVAPNFYNNPFYGYLDNLMVYDKELTDWQIQKLMDGNSSLTDREDWMSNTAGADDVVLSGFSELSAAGTTVTLWGRTYDFSEAIMPAQITNQGIQMLEEPINWFAILGGQQDSLTVDSVTLSSSSSTRAVYVGEGHLGEINVSAEWIVEYDGFMKYTITFDPGTTSKTISKLWMDIPMVPSACTNFYYPCRRSGAWPTESFTAALSLKTEPRTYAITLGTPDISLQWVTESDQCYYPRDDTGAISTITSTNSHILRTCVINADKTISKPFTLCFALQAGPVRPRPSGWRGWTPTTDKRYINIDQLNAVPYEYIWWSRTAGDLIPRDGFPAQTDLSLFEDKIEFTSAHFAGFCDYYQYPTRLPEWQKFEKEWQRYPSEIRLDDASNPKWNECDVDTNSTWSQWHIYNANKLFTLTGMRGLYYDNWNQGPSANEISGSGYLDEDGSYRPTIPIFSQRELQRRVYAIVHNARPDDGVIIIHTSGTHILPIISFCDIMYDGEIYGWDDLVPPDGDYFKTFKNNHIQMVLAAKQYGPIPGFHDMTTNFAKMSACGSDVLKIKNQRKLWALLLTNDIHYQAGFTSGAEELRNFWLDHFNLADPNITFHSYWDENPAVKVLAGYYDDGTQDTGSTMWAVAYSKPSGEVLVIVVRDAADGDDLDTTISLQLDRTKLGLPSGTLNSTDLETISLPKGTVDGDVLKIPVSADDFAAVVLTPDDL